MEAIDPLHPRRGRPPGSKTRPRWIRDREKLQPKRPRGRPPGAKNKPKTLEAYLSAAMAITELPPKPAPRPKDQSKVRLGNSNRLNRLTPEERSANGRKAVAARKTHAARAEGTPTGWATHEYAPLLKEAEREAKRIYRKMEQDGTLPEDPLAREALLEVLKLMRLPGDKKLKHSLARTILEYRLAKPTSKQDVTIRTAEEWLDDLAAKETDGSKSD